MSSPAPAPSITTAFVEVPIPVGTPVRKINSLPEDKIRDGHIGRIKRVFAASPQLADARQAEHGTSCAFGYDVSWDKLTGDCYVLGIRLEVAETGSVSSEPDKPEISGASPSADGRRRQKLNPRT